jgi:Ca2+-binding EF-hand superfamily protein
MSFLVSNCYKKNNLTEKDISHIDTNFTNNSNYSQNNRKLKNIFLKDKILNKKKSIRKNYYETEFKIPSLVLEKNDSLASSNKSNNNNNNNNKNSINDSFNYNKIQYRNKNICKSKTFIMNKNKFNCSNRKHYDKKNTYFKKDSNLLFLNFNKSNNKNEPEKINVSLPIIKREIKNIHKFILNSPISTDEKTIITNLKIKSQPFMIDKNFTNFDNFKTRIQPLNNKTKKTIKESSKNYNLFINSVNNPSLGLEGIKKKFPCFAKYVKNNLVFNKKYISKNLNTMMLAEKVGKNFQDIYDLSKKTKLTQASRLKLKCRMINWFRENKKDLIERLLDKQFQKQLLSFSQKKLKEFNTGLTIEDFSSLLKNNKITKDPELIQKLFWVLDEDGDNDLSYKEILIGMEIFHDNTPEEKVKTFFNLCNKDNNKYISKSNFYELLKRNIINKNDINSLKKSVEKIFKKYGNENELTLENLLKGFKEEEQFAKILNRNIVSLKTLDMKTENEIKKDIIMFNVEQEQYIKQKMAPNGEFCEIYDNKFINLVENYINYKDNMKNIKNKYEDFKDELFDLTEDDDNKD